MREKLGNRLVAIVVAGIVTSTLVIALEIAAYYIIVVRGPNFYLPLDLRRLTEILSRDETLGQFDAELGWEPVVENSVGYRGAEKDIDEAALSVFGDSYTQGHPWIEGSWPYLLEQRLEKPVLNFGVGGYGTDQAYLRFRLRYIDKLSTPYVGLFIMSENIARNINVYRGFYMRRVEIGFTKPRFEITESNSIRLVPNPVRNFEEIRKLSDAQFLQKLGETDYWFQYFERFDLNRHVRFPYSIFMLRALPFYVSRTYKQKFDNYADYKALYSNSEATTILRYLIIEFIRNAGASGAVPLIVFFPNQKDLTDYAIVGTTVYNDFYEMIKSDDYGYVFDGLRYFKPHITAGRDVATFFLPRRDGHYNLETERVISDGLYDDLCRVDQKYGFLPTCSH